MEIQVALEGMTCGGCEMHVEKAISQLEGVIFAKANHSLGRCQIRTDSDLDDKQLNSFLSLVETAVKEAGYQFKGLYQKKEKRDFSPAQWVGIIVVLAALFLLVRETGIMNRLPVIEASMGYGLIFIIGLMTSVHCIGMCGGINLSVSVSALKGEKKEKNTLARIKPAFLYNAGRVVSYTVIGGFVGALGSVISLSGSAQGIIVGFAGVVMITMGLGMVGILPGIDRFLPRMPKKLTARIQNAGSGKGPFVVGLLNGFMPCGPLQSVQIYALGTGSALAGAFSMFLFSLGTVPLMLGFGSLSTLLPPRFHGRILKVSAIFVLLLGSGMVLRGMSLNGLSLAGSTGFTGGRENVRIAEIREGKQYVTTIMHGNEYEPFIVQAGIPVVWTIFASEAELNGCNNPLTVPDYNIRFTMVPGDNVIEFLPPDKPGNITYTCWMGMITSGIKVVEDLALVDDSLLSDTASLSGGSDGSCSSDTGGGCGMSKEVSSSSNITDYFDKFQPEITTQTIEKAAITEDGRQKAVVTVTAEGFRPSILIIEKDREIDWILQGSGLNEETYRIYFPLYQNQGVELGEGENVLTLLPQADFAYYTWKNDFGGFVKVVDNLDTASPELVRDQVELFNKSNRQLILTP